MNLKQRQSIDKLEKKFTEKKTNTFLVWLILKININFIAIEIKKICIYIYINMLILIKIF